MRDPNDIIHNGKTLAEWLEINQTEDTDLSGADLSHADLSYADLSYAIGDEYSLFYGGKHSGWATCSHVGVGCEMHTHAEWRKRFVEIGKENEYTDEEIERYRQWIFSLDWLIEKGTE